MKKRSIGFLGMVLSLLFCSVSIHAQGDGPRSHFPAPKGVWALNPKYLYLDQNILPAGNILVKDTDLNIHLFPTTLVHTFGIGGQFARVFAMVNPGSLTGAVVGSSLPITEELSASGFSDGFLAVEVGVLGNPVLDAISFAQTDPQFGLSGYFRYWYSGTYDSDELINLGTNRSTFELGTTMAIPFHKTTQQNATWWEIMATVQLYTDNNDPVRANTASSIGQEPLMILENHFTHNIIDPLWVGVDLRYQYGGATKADGISDQNRINLLGGGFNVGYQILPPLSAYAGYDTIIFGDNGARSQMLRLSVVFAYVNLNKLKKKQ